jgi:anthranilate phosphoribosyltransferase
MSADQINLPGIIRALGRGKSGTRHLTLDEAHFTMSQILQEKITGPQLGAFLMLMRVKEETPEEIAGMVNACHQHLNFSARQSIDINWPAYAGKKKQASWYLLAAKLLAGNGIRILIHGGGEHTEGRQYAASACAALSIPSAADLKEAEQNIADHGICYLPLSGFLPKLSRLIDMKAELGLRSPVNTLVRHINPLNASVTIQGMFHPGYMSIHHESAKILGQDNNIVVKGDGGEFEVRPDSETKTSIHSKHKQFSGSVPAVLKQRQIRPEMVSLEPLVDTWNGHTTDLYGEAAAIQTAALLHSQLKKNEFSESVDVVRRWWNTRID